MMVLKEAFRMQNYLDTLLDSALIFLSYTENITLTTEEHLRHKANPSDEDETIEVKKTTELVPNDVMAFTMDVLAEKERLYKAISDAKRSAAFDIDTSLALNKSRQRVLHTMKSLVDLKAAEKQIRGQGYLIDGDGKQSPYVYDVKVTKTIDYDRNKSKSYAKKLRSDSEDISNKVDLLNVTLEVDYTPKYEVGDSFEEALALFIA